MRLRVPFTELIDLACANVGGRVLECSNDFFAEKENLLKVTAPVFIADKYTDFGKWMDGWESQRKRVPGHDWCVVQLGLPGIVHGVCVDTSFFTGNYPEYCSIDASLDEGKTFKEFLKKTRLQGDVHNLLPVWCKDRVTHLKLHIYPDGGVARLRVYGEVKPDWKKLGANGAQIDLAAAVNGASVVAANDMHYGSKDNILFPGRAAHMGEGWETRRSRGPNQDWIIIKLAHAGVIEKIEVDTNHFKGNYPDACLIEACSIKAADMLACDFRDCADMAWVEILPKTKLEADKQHVFELKNTENKFTHRFTHLRMTIYPDGGISRLRVWGKI